LTAIAGRGTSSGPDAAGKTTSRAYDKDSLVVSTTDAEGNTTLISYDERGKVVEQKVPHSKDGTGTITYRTPRPIRGTSSPPTTTTTWASRPRAP
jgi:YD repeat-containing protein